MNDNFNTQFAALLTDSGMNEHIAPLQANIMGQLLTQNPQAVTILLQCIANGDTDGAKDILRELFETSTDWIVNHFNENADEIHEDFMASI